MRTTLISFLIGCSVTATITYFSYVDIKRQNQNDYLKEDSKFFETLEFLQNRIDDLKMTTRSQPPSEAPLALIAIDDASIDEIGRWPWSRTTLAQITDEVLSNGAQTLTFDILFSEPERENPAADRILSQTIQKYPDRVILGTASSGQYPAQTHPYQDICTAEAFLYLGGDRIVPLNSTFVVDDLSENFESYKWKNLFEKIFFSLSENLDQQFLQNLKLKSKTDLNLYQKNALTAQKNKAIYNYCSTWLTTDDLFLQKSMLEQIMPFYEAAFDQKLDAKAFTDLTEKIKKTRAHPIPQYLGWYANTPLIQSASNYTASFNTKMDSDGLIRRYPLFYRAGSKIGSSYIPSLALQTYLLARFERAEVGLVEAVQKNEKEITEFKIFKTENAAGENPGLSLPVDAFAQLRLNYYGPEKSFYYVSAKELLTKNQKTIEVQIRKNNQLKTEIVDKAAFFKDRSVFVGATALGIYDVRNTPMQNAMPGPEIHLTALANLLEKRFISTLPAAEWVVPLATALLGVGLSLIWSWVNALASLTILVGLLISLTTADYLVFLKKNYLLPSWSFYAVFIFTFTAATLYKYFTEERNKQKVRKAFSKYVSPAIVEELLKSEKNLELGGQKKVLTVLFSDLRGFTTFSEKLEPKKLSDFLNLYLTRMSAEIFKAKGTVDKFIGDAIMSFFGAPVPFENNAQMACRCALQSIQQLRQLNLELQGQNFPKLEMGIGVNTGEMSVGNMGSATIQNYTVMGDAVNLASRFEGLTRLYGNHVIIGFDTHQAVKDEFTCREIDRVIVKGKTLDIQIYDLIYEGPVKTEDETWLNLFKLGREEYLAGHFEKALDHFKKSANLKPDDAVALYYVKKCQSLIENPPAEKWTGINLLREK